jgi:DNA-binding MarR family transcriptional regulator
VTDPLGQLAGYLLRRAAGAAVAELNARLAALRLRHADVALLMLIESNALMTQSRAGRLLDIERANMVPFVARLEKRGLIRRRQVDGRSQALELTARGRQLLDRARQVVHAHDEALLARVPDPLRPAVLPVLAALWGEGAAAAGVARA